jgi:NAD(P)-dependent dehydrogenase (short-subunit alcohol dehydrogenase family)
MRFKEQTIIVTGAGYGIGREIALAFGREGGNVVLAARSKDKLEAVAEELRGMGTQPLVAIMDQSREPEVERTVAAALETYGGIDVLVNNSGIAGPTAAAQDITAEQWEEVIDINLNGAFYFAKHCARHMIEKRAGCMINISSMAGRLGFALRTPYAASKWGMIGLNHSLAEEMGQYGIRVNAVLPGATEGERITNVMRAQGDTRGIPFEKVQQAFLKKIPLGRMPTESDTADAVLFLASDAARSITGQALQVDGGQRMQ